MPYGMGYSGSGGPVEWAAQKQAQQNENFYRLINLLLGQQQNETEQDWKQKEYGMTQQRYADAAAQRQYENQFGEKKFGAEQTQRGIENKNVDRTYDLNKSNIEVDNARQAAIAKEQAKKWEEDTLNRQEDRASRVEQAGLTRASIEAQKAAALAAAAEPSPGKIRAAYQKERSIVIGRHQMGRKELMKAKATALSGMIIKTPQKIKELNDYYDAALSGLDADKENAIGELDLTYGQGAAANPGGGDLLSGIDPDFVSVAREKKLTDKQIAAKWAEWNAEQAKKANIGRK